MVRLSKKTEYALMVVQYMAVRPHVQISAKDLARRLELPPALMAKVVQALVKGQILTSVMGAGGGYKFKRGTTDVSVADVIEAVEGQQRSLVDCQEPNHDGCDKQVTCTIREPLAILNEQILTTLKTMTVADLVRPQRTIARTVQLEVP